MALGAFWWDGPMGKVRDEAPAAKTAKPAPKGTATPGPRRRFAPFLANLVRTTPYKPMQGWYARLWTGVGLGALLAVGIWRSFELARGWSNPLARLGIPALVGAALAWLVIRLIQYPPFADFLIATEAEMNKVSWTSKADLQRATSVVLVTVALMSVFLFGVDWIWSYLLQVIGVLKFTSSDFGSTAG
jgi:preprotein translocase subunit SecE